MKKLTRIEMTRARVIKAYRTAIRLKHSLAADEEVNNTLPDVIDRFERAIASGKPFELTPGEIFSLDD